MKIVRDGKEIELTYEEMRSAYFEMEHEWDKDFLKDMMENIIEAGSPDLVKLAERYLQDSEYADRVTYKYRSCMDGAEDGNLEWDCTTEALRYMA